MTEPHPVHALRAKLETERLDAVQRLAATNAVLSPSVLTELAYLQLALTAVKEEIETHSMKLGWNSNDTLE